MQTTISFAAIMVMLLGSGASALAQPSILDFGQVSIGSYRDDSLPVVNSQSSTETLFGLHLPPPFYSLDPDSVSIGAFDTAQLHFRFRPTTAGRDTLIVGIYPGNPTLFEGVGITSSVAEPQVSGSTINLVSYPNPASSSMTISYDLLRSGRVVLKLYDLTGNEIATFVDENESAGNHLHAIESRRFVSGQYICRMNVITANGESVTADCKITVNK